VYFSYIFYFYYYNNNNNNNNNNNGLLVVTIIKLDLAGPLGVCLAYVWNFVSVYLILKKNIKLIFLDNFNILILKIKKIF
jgi:hypothetical protein